MKIITRIARQELGILFHSPVAWLILIVFPIQIGIDHLTYIEMVGKAQRMGSHFSHITAMVFAGKETFFVGVKNTLYLYIPLLTMGLISRETHSGSIKLLLSSPVKVRDIVLGKYLAMMLYGLLLLAIIWLYCISGAFFIKNMDWGLLASGTLGIYLLICAYAAIGLYMSLLTSYQVVAAISTLAVLALLNFVGGLFQGNDVIRHITYFISISGRTEQFISGLISSEDVLYFIIIITFFLAITCMKMEDQRNIKSSLLKALRYIGVIAVCFLAGYLSSKPSLTGYIDMTATRQHTLGPQSRALVKQMDQPLKITTYVNVLDNNFYLGAPEKKSDDERRMTPYRRFLPDMKMDYVYYYDFAKNDHLYKRYPGESDVSIAKKVADIQNMDFDKLVPPERIRKMVNLAPEENRLVRQLQYGDRKTFLRFFDDMMIYPSEREVTAALERLVNPGNIPLVTFVTGNRERSIVKSDDGAWKMFAKELSFRAALINQGFDVDTVNIASQDIPLNTSVLVIANPGSAIPTAGIERISRYLEEGGNLLLALEPGQYNGLDTLLQTLGVKVGDTPVREESADYAPDFILAHVTDSASAAIPGLAGWKAAGAIISMPGAASLAYEGSSFNATPLLEAANGSALAMALQRKVNNHTQKILLSGDADFMSTGELSRNKPSVSNGRLTSTLFQWFTDGKFPVNTGAIPPRDSIDSKDSGIMLMRILFFGVLPGLLLVYGAILLIYRKRR